MSRGTGRRQPLPMVDPVTREFVRLGNGCALRGIARVMRRSLMQQKPDDQVVAPPRLP